MRPGHGSAPTPAFGLLDNTQPLRETSCKSRRSPFLLLSSPPWPSLAAPRRKKLPLPKPPLLKPLPPLLKPPRLLTLPPRPLTPLLRLLTLLPRPLLTPLLPRPLKLPRPLRPSNQSLTGLMKKGCFGTLFYCLNPGFS